MRFVGLNALLDTDSHQKNSAADHESLVTKAFSSVERYSRLNPTTAAQAINKCSCHRATTFISLIPTKVKFLPQCLNYEM